MDADTESIEIAEEAYYDYDADVDHFDDEEDDHIEDHFGWESLGIGLGLGEEVAIAEQPIRTSETQNNKLPLSARHKMEESKSAPEDLTKPSNWLTKLGNLKYYLNRNLTGKEKKALEIASDISDILKSEREFNRIDAERAEKEQKVINQRKKFSNLKIRNVGKKLLEHRKSHG